MNSTKQVGTTILGLFFLLGMVAGLSLLAWKLSSSSVAPTAITAAVGLVSAVAVQAYSASSQKRKEIEIGLREKKVPIYEGTMDLWFDHVLKLPTIGDKSAGIVLRKLREQDKEMILWASDDVLKTYAFFKRTSNRSIGGTMREVPEVLRALEQLLFSIRRDLGHKNKDLNQGDLLGLFVNDLYVVEGASPAVENVSLAA